MKYTMIVAWKLLGDQNERRDDGLGRASMESARMARIAVCRFHRSQVARINQAADSNTTP